MSALRSQRVETLDKALEITFLLRAGEVGFARDHRVATAFGACGDARRLDAFTLGMLDKLARTLDMDGLALPLLVYLDTVIELGPGESARERAGAMMRLFDQPELRRYVIGGRAFVARALTHGAADTGLYARLLGDELEGK